MVRKESISGKQQEESNMQQQMLQLEQEMARLQVELRQVRQMIGSLIRTEMETTQRMNNYAASNQANNQQGSFGWQQSQEIGQYNQMRQMAERMNRQIHDYNQSLMAPRGTGMYNDMNPRNQDPMVRVN
jgi:hypothetical protein